MKTSQEEYKVSDLAFASFLRCKGVKLRNILPGTDGRCLFIFERIPDIESLVIQFANDGEIAARPYFNTIRDLKALLRKK